MREPVAIARQRDARGRRAASRRGSESATRDQARGRGRIRPSRAPAAQPGPEQAEATEEAEATATGPSARWPRCLRWCPLSSSRAPRRH